ncbi:MAG: aminopeptidase [Bacteroidales bacterium]|jgi:hypothetical protein|nr:aminopeptidase [Bacteroidales bacterium]MCI2144946.1 aminopeptidase [Bacteroidales bacterium]
MKHTIRAFTALFAFCLIFSIDFNAAAQPEFKEQLSKLDISIDSVMTSDFYAGKYLCTITEPLDWKHPEKGSFQQRFLVMNRGVDKPTVVETEGYGAAYAMRPGYVEELTRILDANLVFVEHRFFLKSVPDSAHFDWKYMTAENSANDLHHVVTAMKNIYHGKWVASGISKGGQTALIYRAFYPNDVDVSVPYVAPLCSALEDGRHEPFIADSTGTPEGRAKVLAFQREVLKRRDLIQPLFDSLCKAKGYVFRMSLPEALDYTVMEFSFSFWQWGFPVESLPDTTETSRTLFKYLIHVDDPEYFTASGDVATLPFNYQAAHELGYYGYDLSPFKDLAVVKSTKGYFTRYMLPEGAGNVKFSDKLYKKLSKFLKTTDAKMLFVYGEYDPWSAVRVPDYHKENIKIFIVPGGCHRSRINSMPEEMRKEAVDTLKNWLGI